GEREGDDRRGHGLRGPRGGRRSPRRRHARAVAFAPRRPFAPNLRAPAPARRHREAKGGADLSEGARHSPSARARRPLGGRARAQEGEMTANADFKRRVRERMARTGESYTAARAQLLGAGTLHVTNGDSTVNGIAATGLPGRIIAWRDALHE